VCYLWCGEEGGLGVLPCPTNTMGRVHAKGCSTLTLSMHPATQHRNAALPSQLTTSVTCSLWPLLPTLADSNGKHILPNLLGFADFCFRLEGVSLGAYQLKVSKPGTLGQPCLAL
jgi:hypothetical protein